MNKLWKTHEQVTNKVWTSCENESWRSPKSCDNKARDRQNYYSWCRVWCWWFPTVVKIRLYQPPAGAWLAGARAELGNNLGKNWLKAIDNMPSSSQKLELFSLEKWNMTFGYLNTQDNFMAKNEGWVPKISNLGMILLKNHTHDQFAIMRGQLAGSWDFIHPSTSKIRNGLIFASLK